MYRRSAYTRSANRDLYKRNDLLHWLNDTLFFVDVIAGALIGYFSVEIYIGISANFDRFPGIGLLIWRELVLTSVITALVVRKADYTPENEKLDIAPAMRAVATRAAGAAIILFAIGLATGTLHDMARLWIAVWAALFLGWLSCSRLALLFYQRHLTRQGALREAVAIITTDANTALVSRIRSAANVVAVVDRFQGDETAFKTALNNVVGLARDGAIGLVILAVGKGHCTEQAAEIISQLKIAPVQVAACTDDDAAFGLFPRVRIAAGVRMTLVVDHPLSSHDLLAKAIIDKLGAVILLALASPLLIAVALAIMVETNGPVIFRQRRSGCGGKPFTVFKFRTMRHTPRLIPAQQTVRGDPRCTAVGAFLRKTSMDELPQLFNVLLGDMSLVGPRPHADYLHVRENTAKCILAEYTHRQRVKPGLTGWAQVHGLRGAADTPEKLRQRVELDLYYIEHWSIWLDLNILARTPWAIWSAENAF